MKVVNISLSPSILDEASVSATRIGNYGSVVDEYIVVIPYTEDVTVKLHDNVVAYGVSGGNKLTKLWRVRQKIVSLINEGRCDVLATDQYFFGLLGVFLSQRFKIGHEVIALGFEKFTWLRKQIAGFVLKRAGSIRVNSPRLVDFIESEFGIVGEKVHMVPIYVDTEKIGLKGERTSEEQTAYDTEMQQFADQYGASFNFISVNRLVPAKNISLQLQAMAKLAKTNQNIALHILGDGPLEAELQSEIEELNLTEQVWLHGHTTGMRLGAFYNSADCFLLTSNNEGWGMVIVEALTAQLPVVMTDVGAAGEIIFDGESGIVIPIGDVEALARAMQKVIEDQPFREQIIAGGQKALAKLLPLSKLLEMYRTSWEYSLRK